MTRARSSSRSRRWHGERLSPTLAASSVMLNRPSTCSSARIFRSMASTAISLPRHGFLTAGVGSTFGEGRHSLLRMIDRTEQVRAWIDDHADELAELLIRLVAVESENPPGRNLAECAEVLRAAMDRLGFAPAVIEIEASGPIED